MHLKVTANARGNHSVLYSYLLVKRPSRIRSLREPLGAPFKVEGSVDIFTIVVVIVLTPLLSGMFGT